MTRTVRGLGGPSGALLSAVLADVAAQASRYDTPRALALFAMLDVNRRSAAIGARGDIRDADGVVYRYYAGHGFQFQPLAAFARLNQLVARGASAAARRLATALVARGIPVGDALYWEYFFPFGGPSHWTSGFAQAIAAQSLARTADLVDEPALGRAARAAFRAVPERLSFRLGGGTWVREYSFTGEAILNAQLQTLVSLTDYASRTSALDVGRMVARLETASRALLVQFDTGCWSRYSLGGPVADVHYHTYHVRLLQRLAATRPAPIWRSTARRWSRFLQIGCGR